MYDKIRYCKRLEEDLSITTRNGSIYTNIGILVSTNVSDIIDICQNDFARRRLVATKNKHIFESKLCCTPNRNIVITQPYLLDKWNEYTEIKVVKNASVFEQEFNKNYIVVVPVNVVFKNLETFTKHHYKRVILHNCKEHIVNLSESLFFDFKWFVYSCKELVPDILYCNNRDIVDSILVDTSSNTVVDIVRIPCKKPIVSLTLNGLVDEVLLNNIDKYNIKHIIKHLTDTSIKTEKDVIRCILRKFQEQLKMIDTHEYCINNMFFANDSDKINKLDKLIKQRNDICEKEKELIKRITTNELCFICYSEIEVQSILRCCSNKLCFECLQKWKKEKNICPLCKKEPLDYYIVEDNNNISPKQNLTNDTISKEHSIFNNFKFLITKSLRTNQERHILILGSDYKFIKRFENILTELNKQFVSLNGNFYCLQKQLKLYKNENKILIINTNKIHSGIELANIRIIITLTTDIIAEPFIKQCKNVQVNYILEYSSE